MGIATFNDPRRISEVVPYLPRPRRFFLERAFPSIVQFDDQQVTIDLEKGGKRLAAFCSPDVGGKIVAEHGFSTREITPAYIKEKTILKPRKSFKRRIGEQIGGAIAPGDRSVARLVESLNEKIEAIHSRKEWMASTILQTGKLIIQGPGYPRVELDYKRDASLTIVLANDKKWGTAGADILGDIERFTSAVVKAGGGVITDIVMTIGPWLLAFADEKFQKALDNRSYEGAKIAVGPNMDESLVAYKGYIGNVRIWVYEDYYEILDDDGEVESREPFLADGYIVGFGSRIDGRQYHGAIMDEDAGLQSMEYFGKSWTEKDPSARVLLVQSSPVVAPLRADNTFSAKVY